MIKEFLKKKIVNIINSVDYFIAESIYFFNKTFKKKNINYKEKNIMILVTKLNNGGAERVAANLSNILSKKYNLILVTIGKETEADYKTCAKRISIGRSNAKFFINLNNINRIKKIKKKYNITHTISFCSKMNYFNVMSKGNDKAFISIRSHLRDNEKEVRYKHINKIAGKYSDKIVVLSKLEIDDQVNFFGAKREKIFCIYNFCNNEFIDEKLKEGSNEIKEENMVINVGRLSYQKGQIHLIKAFKKVVTEIPNAKLIILGKGELKVELDNAIKKYELQKNVYLLDFQENPYIYMKKSSLFVLNSFYEGMSNALLEAMYCGLPIIATDCKTGSREILAPDTDINFENTCMTKEKYGILVPVIKNEKDEVILAEAIIEVLKDNELRKHYEEKSIERINDFSKEKIIKDWIELIEK